MSTLTDTFGVDVNATSKEGDTPLMFACANGAWDIVALLLAAGAKSHGSDALHAAVSAARTDTVDTLIATGVDLDTIDEQYWTACHYAVAQNNAELLDRLIAAGASVDVVDESLIHLAVIASLDGTLIQRLVAAGADVNATQGWERKTACHVAVHFNKPAVLRALIVAGAMFDVLDNVGCTPLKAAVKSGSRECCTLLRRCHPTRSRRIDALA